MAVAHSVSATGTHGASSSGVPLSMTLGSSDTALTVEVGGYYPFENIASLTAHTVKIGTTPLILLGYLNNDNIAGYGWTELWGLINPPTGAQVITVVENFSSTPAYLNIHADSYTGVTSFGTPVGNYSNIAGVNSGSIVSAVGDMVVSAQGCYPGYTLSSPSGTARYNYEPGGDYVTLLAQDAAGAATVPLTSTYSGNGFFGWGTISVNLVAGNQKTGNATATATFSASASAAFVGSVRGSGSLSTVTASASASGLVTVFGSPLRYVGRYPDTDAVVVPVAYAQADNASVSVTPAWVTQQVNIAAANCVSEAWVLGQVANYQTQTQLTAALSAYVPQSALGANSGIAESNGSNMIPTGQLPTVVTNSLATCYDVYGSSGSVVLESGSWVTSTTQNVNEIIVAQISVPDPGYPWYPLPFAYVYAGAGGTSSLLTSGTGNVGCLTVVIDGNLATYYGVGICTDDPNPSYYPLLPYGLPANTNNVVAGAMTPTTNPPLPPTTTAGETVFQLGACNLPGVANSNDYNFGGLNLIYYILVVPAL